MTAWLITAAAAAFWAGMLGWELLRGGVGDVSGWWLFGAGALGLGVAIGLAPARRHDPSPSPLAAGPAGEPGGPSPPIAEPLGPARSPAAAVAALLLAAFVLMGAGWWERYQERVAGSTLLARGSASATLWGSLASDPVAGSRGWSARMACARIGPYSATGPGDPAGHGVRAVRETVWVSGEGALPDARRGDRVAVTGTVEPPWSEEFADSLRRRGIAVVVSADALYRLGPPGDPLGRAAASTRRTLVGRIQSLFPPREAGLLMGLVLGDTSRLDPADEEHFRATGLGHLLAVSGQNVAMVLAPVLGLAMLMRVGAGTRFAIGLGTVVFFVLLTGVEPSVLRAGTMAGFALAGVLLGRPGSSLPLLGVSVLILLLLDPSLAWSVGFQLSVAATAGLVTMAGPLSERLRFMPRPLAMALGASMAAQIAVTPLLLSQFRVVPLVTLVANLLALPAVAPGLLIGLAAAGASLVAAPLGSLLAGVSGPFVRYLEVVADRLASLPVPSLTSGGGPAILGVGLAAAIGFAVWLRSGRRLPRRAVLMGCVLLPLFVWAGAIRAGPPGHLFVRFFDVGQGDGALVTAPDGATVLIDAGPEEQDVAIRLAALGVKRLDAVVATHAHADHEVGLPAVLARFPVGVLLEPGCEDHSPGHSALHRAVRDEGIAVRHPRAGEVITVGGLRLDVLAPDRCHVGTNSDPNNDSIVLRISWGDDVVLFTGCVEVESQEVLLRDPGDLAAEVLRVPHHGGGTSLPELFDAVHPAVAVISVGEDNFYGHPAPEVVERLESVGAVVLRTDRSGEVTLSYEDSGLLVRTAAGEAFLVEPGLPGVAAQAREPSAHTATPLESAAA